MGGDGPERLDTVTHVTEAQLPQSERGAATLASGREVSWHTGAAYDRDGALVQSSRRVGGLAGDFLFSFDQERIELPPNARREEGSWYYGGLWMQHFGHFLIETLPTLWAYDGKLPVLFHRLGDTAPWKLELLQLAGAYGQPIFIDEPLRIEHLVVPGRPVSLNHSCTPAAVRLWNRVAANAGAEAGERKIWLSRSLAESGGASVNRTLGHEELDAKFDALGFEVVHPETMSMTEQVRLGRSASVLAGFEGSALHLSAFAMPGTKVFALGSQRRPRGNRAQPIIDRAVGNRLTVVDFTTVDQMMLQVREKLQSD